MPNAPERIIAPRDNRKTIRYPPNVGNRGLPVGFRRNAAKAVIELKEDGDKRAVQKGAWVAKMQIVGGT